MIIAFVPLLLFRVFIVNILWHVFSPTCYNEYLCRRPLWVVSLAVEMIKVDPT